MFIFKNKTVTSGLIIFITIQLKDIEPRFLKG